MTHISDYLISYEITKGAFQNPIFKITFKNLDTNQFFWDILMADRYLVAYFKEKIKATYSHGACTISAFMNEAHEVGKLTLYKDHIIISPEFETFIKSFLWNSTFEGAISESTFKLNSDIPDLLKGL